ncbi:hypothetical protein Y032_0008g288 [Ancylostoma ceylanicum]|uniref:L-Fucosyltransferase n=1 Tax=Ancylostoma ceylanicum TaxID=53326 RepID=A0A016VLX6_9BILA|nr:hypothetical protein Y032_0008g288 [Ancylostoma ceylanicum]
MPHHRIHFHLHRMTMTELISLLAAISFVWFFVEKSISSDHLRYTTEEKYVALRPIRHRIGNQLFHIASGYGIARTLKRKLYYSLPESFNITRKYLNQLAETFPKTARIYEILQNESVPQTEVQMATDTDMFKACCKFYNPCRLIHHPAKFLFLKMNLVQNRRYFEDYLPELHDILQFSEASRERGEHSLRLLNMSNASATMCIHVRRTDFHRFGLETEWNGTVSAAQNIARKRGLGNYLIFGDDKAFMSSLATELERDTFTGAQPKAFISMFSEVTDFYLSSQLCSALLLSAASSTFGWWLGFFARNQNAVYYYKSGRPVENFRFLRNEFFLKSWRLYDGGHG